MMNFDRMITTIDAHTAGEPLRIITSGLPQIPGKTILEKRQYMKENYDDLRKLMMLEPRGHSGMYGCILTPPVTEDGDLGVLFTHNEGLSTMCGHGIIAVSKVLVETKMIQIQDGENVIRIDSPAGRITAYVEVHNGKARKVKFKNVPSFVYKKDIQLRSKEGLEVKADIVYCGAFYIYVDADQFDLEVDPKNIEALIKVGMELKYKAMKEMEIVHPLEKGLRGIYGTIFSGPIEKKGQQIISKNVCIFADGQVDRSPTGTGTAGRVALLHHKGILWKDMTLVNKSIINTVFEARIDRFTTVDQFQAVIPEVSGTAHIMGFNQLVLDPEDPLPNGFKIIGG